MPTVQVIMRFFRRYIFTFESLVIACSTIVIYQLLIHGNFWWTYLKWKVTRSMAQRTALTGNILRDNMNAQNAYSQVNGDILNDKNKASWELRKGNVGVYAIQGKRNRMEDRFNVVNDLEHTDTSIYGVFDGHGGEFAADFVEKTLFRSIMLRLLKSAVTNTTESFGDVLKDEILNVDKQLLTILRATSDISGTTALVALCSKKSITVANVGDSRGIMCDKDGNVIPLSEDHKPYLVNERKRIEAAGGFISFVGVWRVAGILATSRALGDFPLKDQNFLTAEPEIMTFDLEDKKPQFAILASDGLWDVFTNEKAVEYIKERLHEPDFGAKSIVMQAYRKGSLDNITVIVIKFGEENPARRDSNA